MAWSLWPRCRSIHAALKKLSLTFFDTLSTLIMANASFQDNDFIGPTFPKRSIQYI